MPDEIVGNTKVKIVIGKLFEIAYKKNEGVTTALIQKRGAFTMRIDENGNVDLSGKAGHVKFKGKPALEEMGIDLNYGSVMFSNA